MKVVKDVVLYDFDGTIYKKDSFITFLIYAIPTWKLIFSFLIFIPTLVKMIVRLKSNEESKQRIFCYFFKGMDIKVFDDICTKYQRKIDNNVSNILKLKIKQNQDFQQIIVSASISNWIIPWAKANNIDHVIATEIEVDKYGKITGNFATKNCNKEEKVNRIKRYFENKEVVFAEAYGNSKSDFPMFTLAKSAFLVEKDKLMKFK